MLAKVLPALLPPPPDLPALVILQKSRWA